MYVQFARNARFTCFSAASLFGLTLAAPAAAQDAAFTVGVALSGNMTAGQAVPDGYDNASDDGATDIPSSGFGGGLAVLARRSVTERSQLRAGVRTGYSQGKALFDLSADCNGDDDCVEFGALRGSAFFGSAVIGGEAHLGNPDAVRPYLLGELGFGAAQLWPRARADENNLLTCAVSVYCATAETEAPTGRETGRVAVGPLAVVGLGVAVPTTPVRVEASYVWHSLLGGPWRIAGESPGTSLSMVELSVGYLFGG